VSEYGSTFEISTRISITILAGATHEVRYLLAFDEGHYEESEVVGVA